MRANGEIKITENNVISPLNVFKHEKQKSKLTWCFIFYCYNFIRDFQKYISCKLFKSQVYEKRKRRRL